MPTSRRVNITLTFATDEAPTEVLYSLHAAVRDECRFEVEATSVHAFDLDEPDDEAATVCLVLTDTSVRWATPDEAEQIAAAMRGVVVELPISADYRRTP